MLQDSLRGIQTICRVGKLLFIGRFCHAEVGFYARKLSLNGNIDVSIFNFTIQFV